MFKFLCLCRISIILLFVVWFLGLGSVYAEQSYNNDDLISEIDKSKLINFQQVYGKSVDGFINDLEKPGIKESIILKRTKEMKSQNYTAYTPTKQQIKELFTDNPKQEIRFSLKKQPHTLYGNIYSAGQDYLVSIIESLNSWPKVGYIEIKKGKVKKRSFNNVIEYKLFPNHESIFFLQKDEKTDTMKPYIYNILQNSLRKLPSYKCFGNRTQIQGLNSDSFIAFQNIESDGGSQYDHICITNLQGTLQYYFIAIGLESSKKTYNQTTQFNSHRMFSPSGSTNSSHYFGLAGSIIEPLSGQISCPWIYNDIKKYELSQNNVVSNYSILLNIETGKFIKTYLGLYSGCDVVAGWSDGFRDFGFVGEKIHFRHANYSSGLRGINDPIFSRSPYFDIDL